jgi:hypothetical protein
MVFENAICGIKRIGSAGILRTFEELDLISRDEQQY